MCPSLWVSRSEVSPAVATVSTEGLAASPPHGEERYSDWLETEHLWVLHPEISLAALRADSQGVGGGEGRSCRGRRRDAIQNAIQ